MFSFSFKQIFNGNVLYSGHSSKAEDIVTKETKKKDSSSYGPYGLVGSREINM